MLELAPEFNFVDRLLDVDGITMLLKFWWGAPDASAYMPGNYFEVPPWFDCG